MSITMWIDFSLQKIYLQCNLVDRFSPSEKACHGFRATARGLGGPKNLNLQAFQKQDLQNLKRTFQK